MFKYIVTVAVALGAVGFLTQDAAAGEVKIKQNCNSQCLQSACDAVGGQFMGFRYSSSCINESKGTQVTCNNDGTDCIGWVPRGGKPGGSLSSILKGGAAPVGPPTGYGVEGTPPGPKQPSVRAPSAPMGVKPAQGPSPAAPIPRGPGKR